MNINHAVNLALDTVASSSVVFLFVCTVLSYIVVIMLCAVGCGRKDTEPASVRSSAQ